jgi:biopolymer transport protein ExbD
MKIRHSAGGLPEKIPIDMTPMIDIVFQLLAFFIMTLKVVVLEGDFNIKMPIAAVGMGAPTESLLPPMHIGLRAAADGQLAEINFGERNLGTGEAGFRALQSEVIAYIGGAGPNSLKEEAEVEIDADYDLQYQHVIDCVSAVTGYRGEDGQIVTLVEKIKFTPPERP